MSSNPPPLLFFAMGPALACALWLVCAASTANAQSTAHSSSEPTLSSGPKFSEIDGKELYANICQGCHMSDGKGASGAGVYPSLVKDVNLQSGGYPIHIVLNGQRAMPPFGRMLSDDQVAAVVNYLRRNFGNGYTDDVTPDDIKIARP